MSEARLIDLETKFSFQEAQIEELRQTVHDQYLMIKKLEKLVKILTEKMMGAEAGALNTNHEKPPHY